MADQLPNVRYNSFGNMYLSCLGAEMPAYLFNVWNLFSLLFLNILFLMLEILLFWMLCQGVSYYVTTPTKEYNR